MRVYIILIILLLTQKLSLAQNSIRTAAFVVKTGSIDLIINFIILNDVLASAKVDGEGIKNTTTFRIEKRTESGFIMSGTDLRGRNRLVVDVDDDDERLSIYDGNGKFIGLAKWLNPRNGKTYSKHCDNCLDEANSFMVLRKARASEE
jgi:hypothetical protein